MGRALWSKEDLLFELNGVLQKAGVSIDDGHKVTAIDGDDGAFVVGTERGLKVRARAVVLARGCAAARASSGCPARTRARSCTG